MRFAQKQKQEQKRKTGVRGAGRTGAKRQKRGVERGFSPWNHARKDRGLQDRKQNQHAGQPGCSGRVNRSLLL
jgi:hypothetical protein